MRSWRVAQGASILPCDDLEAWDGRGETQEVGDMCILMTDSPCVQRKPTQRCKGILFQSKKKKIYTYFG